MADLVVFGAGQIAEVAKYYIDAHGPDRIVGFTVDAAFRTSETFCGLPLVAWEELEQSFPPDRVQLLGPLSFRLLNEFRRDRHLEGRLRGYRFASFIHPACHIYTREIGENAFILEANVIQPFVTIGVGAMLWSGNHIGHHTVVGDNCFMASGVAIGGAARVGERCWIGGQVGINAGITIGEACIIGAKTFIKKDLPAESVVSLPGDTPSNVKSSRLKRSL
jgi:sugar O-acyltransferase (sialic acid O-acetyltransferase NeuD family)